MTHENVVMRTRGLAATGVMILALGLTSCTADPVPEPSISSDGDDAHFAAFGTCVDRPAPWLCATIQVPRDRNDEDAGLMSLRILGIPHSDDSGEEALPLFAVPGGPGDAGIENYALWQLPGLIGALHDVVAIDPRGTGLSDAIDCPALQAGAATITAFLEASDACGQQLGDSSDLYGSAQRAMDADAVRDFMGYDRIILHGTSYGGVDVQAYASRFADRLAAAVIDGGFVVDDVDMFFGTDIATGTIVVVDTACRSDAACTASTADPGGVVSEVVRRLSQGPVVEGGAVVVDEASIARLIRDMGLAVEVVGASLAFLAGDTTPMARLVTQYDALGIPSGGDVESFSFGANAAAWCTDQVVAFDITAPPAERQKHLDDALAALDDDTFAPWSKEAWREFTLFDQCVGWPVASRHESVLVGDASFPGIPALLLVGDRDPAVAGATKLEERFPDGITVIVPGAGHPSLSLGLCVARFEASFIETLEVPVGPPCDGG